MRASRRCWSFALGHDKGYRAEWIDEYRLDLGIDPVIPSVIVTVVNWCAGKVAMRDNNFGCVFTLTLILASIIDWRLEKSSE